MSQILICENLLIDCKSQKYYLVVDRTTPTLSVVGHSRARVITPLWKLINFDSDIVANSTRLRYQIPTTSNQQTHIPYQPYTQVVHPLLCTCSPSCFVTMSRVSNLGWLVVSQIPATSESSCFPLGFLDTLQALSQGHGHLSLLVLSN